MIALEPAVGKGLYRGKWASRLRPTIMTEHACCGVFDRRNHAFVK
jgi:hypothetical protein